MTPLVPLQRELSVRKHRHDLFGMSQSRHGPTSCTNPTRRGCALMASNVKSKVVKEYAFDAVLAG